MENILCNFEKKLLCILTKKAILYKGINSLLKC